MKLDSVPQANSEADLPPELNSQVFNILQTYLRELESGQATADELLARHPDHAEALRPYLEQLDGLYRAGAGMRDPAPNPAPLPEGGRLGDFQILREIGRGGMGIVYEAEQLSLRRRVALKVLPFAAVLDRRQLQRFENEAQAAAQLHHTNIVPVYAVGSERGIHYYAMQLIEGQTLAAVVQQQRGLAGIDDAPPTSGGSRIEDRGSKIEDRTGWAGNSATLTEPPAGGAVDARSSIFDPRSSFFQSVARLGVQAAEALEHAHQRGVVHRDVKPANLLIDGAGRLWITDFGLARCRADNGLTLTGDVVGTLRYMSPEQALGKPQAWDCRTDVYSLGVTLYELLALQPAFGARDREQVLLCVAYQDPLPPRKLNRAVPKELETIVLKAMAKDPEGRYATAQELADDLRRFLEDRPILARRPSLRERLVKWSRRHRAVVASAFVLLLLALAGLTVSTILVSRERAAAEAAHENEARAHDKAREHLKLARRAVDDMYTQLAERWLQGQGRLDPVQLEFLEKALRFYERFAQEYADDPAFRRDTALAHRRVGDIHRRAGRNPDARAAYEKAIPLFERLKEDAPDQPEHAAELARAQNNLAVVLKRLGKFAPAEATYQRALGLRTALDLSRPENRSLVGESYYNLALLLADRNRRDEAEAALKSSAEHHRAAAEQEPAVADHAHRLAGPLYTLGVIQLDRGRLPDAEKLLRESLDLERRAARLAPRRVDFRSGLARNCCTLANLLFDRGAKDEAERLHTEGTALTRRVAEDLPGHAAQRSALVGSLTSLGWIQRQRDKWDEADRTYREAIDLGRELVEKHGGVAEHRSKLGAALNNLGELRRAQGNHAESRQLLDGAIREQLAALAVNDRQPTYRRYLESHYGNLAKTLAKLADHEGALRAAAEPARREPGSWQRHQRAANVLGLLARQNAKDADAARAYAEASRHHAAEAARLRGSGGVQ